MAGSLFERRNAASPPLWRLVKAGYKKDNHLAVKSPRLLWRGSSSLFFPGPACQMLDNGALAAILSRCCVVLYVLWRAFQGADPVINTAVEMVK